MGGRCAPNLITRLTRSLWPPEMEDGGRGGLPSAGLGCVPWNAGGPGKGSIGVLNSRLRSLEAWPGSLPPALALSVAWTPSYPECRLRASGQA